MHLLGSYSKAFWCSLCAGLLVSGNATAEVLPWLARHLEDPFATEAKATHLIDADLRPDSCLRPLDLNRKLHFQEVVVAALCDNPDTRAAYLSLLAQADAYGGNYSAYLPTVTANIGRTVSSTFAPGSIVNGTFVPGSVTNTNTRSSGLAGSLTLYDFGQREFKLEVAEQTLVAAGHSYNSTLQGLIATAMTGYFQLLTSQNAVGVAQESERYAKQSYEAAQLRHHIGQVPLADELQAKGAYSQAILAEEQANNQLSQNKAGLALLMGLPADAPVQVAEIDDSSLTNDPFGSDVKTLMENAKQKRADLLASRAQLKGAKASLKALERSDLATVSGVLNLGFDDLNAMGRNAVRSQSIGLSVSIPIFTGFSQTYSERATKKQLRAQEEQVTKAELSVTQDVWNSWHNYETAKHTWETSWDLLASSTQLKDVALGRYKEGLGTILDVLSAQSQYSSALQSQLQSRYSLLATRIDLVRAVGVLDLKSMRPETNSAITPADETTLRE